MLSHQGHLDTEASSIYDYKMDNRIISTLDESARTSIKRKRSDQVAALIRSHIFQAGLQPGDRLPQEPDLIEMFGCSRSTIREALKSLEVQGLVRNTTGPGGGARIEEVSINRIVGLLSNYFYFQHISSAQIYQIRRFTEPELAYSVTGHLTPEHFTRLEATIAVQEQHPGGAADWGPQRHAEIDFHDVLIDACRNPLLGLVCHFINEAMRHLIDKMGMQDFSAAFTAENVDFHKRLLDAFRAGDAARAKAIMYDHMLSAEATVLPADAQAHQPFFAKPMGLD